MKKDSEKGKTNKIKEYFSSKTVKATLFFGFYFFFFLFIALSFNKNFVNNNSNNDKNEVKEESNQLFYTDHITDNDYTYRYIIYENNETITFSGSSQNINQELEDYSYKYFLNIYNLKQIIKNSKYLSKIDSSDSVKYNYEIKTSELKELLEESIDLEVDGLNNIFVYTNSSLDVTLIKIDLSDYMKSHGYNKYVIELNYQEGVDNGENRIN